MPHDRVQRALETRTIEIAPLAYMRGRTLADAFIILDEAQNATGAQMKMFLTRLGVNSKTVVTGDKTQIDLPRREDSGLVQVERILPASKGSRSATCTRPTWCATGWCGRSSRLMRRIRTADGSSGARPANPGPGSRGPDRIRSTPSGGRRSLVRPSSPTRFPPPAGVLSRGPGGRPVVDRTVVAPFPSRSGRPPTRWPARARRGRSRAAGLPLQPDRLRFGAGRGAGLLRRPRSRERGQGPELTRAVAAGPGHLGPEETRYLADPRHRRAMRELVTHFLGETLSRGVADAGVIRGEASRQITLRRNDAERVVAARFHPDLRRPDGAGGGGRHRGGGSGGPADAPAAGRARSTTRPSCPTPRSRRRAASSSGRASTRCATACARASGSSARASRSPRRRGPS